MGGFGSGCGKLGKVTTSEMPALDVRRLQREGLLESSRWFSRTWICNGEEIASIWIQPAADYVLLNYRSRSDGGSWQMREYSVRLEWTSCNLGGQRIWFRCPVEECNRRVAILFGGTVFACRRCQRLAYRCQRETVDDRAARRADRIRMQLGWDAGILNGAGGKPKGMHWTTFWRLKGEHDAFAGKVMDGIAQRLGLPDHQF